MADDSRNLIPDSFKEAVCIDAGRVYDSCCDRDCLEDLRCYFAPEVQGLINKATSVKARSAEVVNVYIDVEPVNFNRGYYSCDLTFFFLIEFDLYCNPTEAPTFVKGISLFTKKVILYGSEGNVKVFSNKATLEGENDTNLLPTTNMPKCVVQCVEPIILSSRIGVVRNCYNCCSVIPKSVCCCIGGNVNTEIPEGTPTIFVTLGLFSIIQLIRNVQMLIPVYDFCIPEKQCDNTADQPCDIFRKIQFPTDDFFPTRAENCSSNCDCNG